MNASNVLTQLAGLLASGGIEVVDCTGTLGPDTPLLKLPPELAKDTPPIKIHRISEYDQDGPFWAWNWLELGEHSGTHFDAPHHWITGKDYSDGYTDTLDIKRVVAPVNVLDFSAECAADPDFLLTVEHIDAWEAQHGAINAGEWVVLRSDWDKRAHDEALFLNANETGPHTPGPTAEAIQHLIGKGIVGWGSQCIGTDAGLAGGMNPPFPAHNLLHANNRFGLASLANLDKLPPKGAILIAAPLKIAQGTGSPIRALALVARG
ncbi:cyclase family protein [Pararhodobacter aggregans]|uniref:Cyclase n=1 Tax=Pararhodobacter aggregans TaxID=404875 RepID=A0A2T7UKC2_9RHOB|nr:cyclase family protein [Pararhodobacter aggregans]PTX03215.1 kynurenine formamidase [Pararhodobacter aggregans]PVE45106.1 cyclase [Pararhodobacter aggregans]